RRTDQAHLPATHVIQWRLAPDASGRHCRVSVGDRQPGPARPYPRPMRNVRPCLTSGHAHAPPQQWWLPAGVRCPDRDSPPDEAP
ncbi:hypothetical protein ABTK67_19000, partial [Acinetobacter baumannii]